MGTLSYLHYSRNTDGSQVEGVNRLQLHPGNEVSRRRSVFREHVRGAIGGDVVVHGAAFEVFLAGNNLVSNLAGPTHRVNEWTFLVTPVNGES